MELATQNHLAQLRHLLNFRLKELRADVHAAQVAHQALQAASREVADRKDEAWQEQLDEIDQAQEARDLAEVAQYEAALQRLDHGVYGDCIDCGEAIPLARLLVVQPAARRRCAGCQAQHEKRALHRAG